MRAVLLCAALLASAPAGKNGRPPAKARPVADAGVDAPVLPALTPMRHAAPGDTACAACHVTSSWADVKFNHERTGFPLTGAHSSTACKGCHATDFEKPVPATCSGCHRDVHAADLGARCEGCHDTATWASRFDADAHRRTAFPLVGAHSTIPCLECHGPSSARRFSRPTVECTACHQAALERTRTSDVNHFALGFSTTCRECHSAFRFKPAIFPNHDSCYLISRGPHAVVQCRGCHTSLSAASTPGACNTRTADCMACHQCSGPKGTLPNDLLHQSPKVAMPVPGYVCQNLKCLACHKEVGVR